MDPVVLVHLSDIHFSASDSGLAIRNAALRTDLMLDLDKMRAEVGEATAVLVTGDIAFSADPKEYDVATAWLKEVSARVGSEPARVLTVPGNHDVHWESIGKSGEDARAHLRTCSEGEITQELEKYLDDPAQPLTLALSNYNDFALGFLSQVPKYGAWEADLPLQRGYVLSIRGMTTVFNSDRNDVKGQLVVGRSQATLENIPERVYMLLAHHPPDECRDAVELRSQMRNRARILLAGHRHDQRFDIHNGHLELIAGAVHPEEAHGWNPTYNWMKLEIEDSESGPELVVSVWSRVHKTAWNEFGPDTDETGKPVRQFRFALPAISASAGEAIPSAPSGEGDDADGSPPAEGAGTESGGSVDQRSALVDEAGSVSPDRRITRDLLDISDVDQIAVLRAAGVLTDDDFGKPHRTMILDAMTRAKGQGVLDEVAAQIARHTEQSPKGNAQ